MFNSCTVTAGLKRNVKNGKCSASVSLKTSLMGESMAYGECQTVVYFVQAT
jgi:hypothetical protein